MKSISPKTRRFCCLAAILCFAATLCATPQVVQFGGSQGGGGVPYSSRSIPTAGCVVDGLQNGLGGLGVIVQSTTGIVVSTATTLSGGEFVLMLPPVEGLQLSVLGTEVSGIAVQAGEPILVVLQ